MAWFLIKLIHNRLTMGRLEYYITTGDLNNLNALLAQNPTLAKYDEETEVSPLMLSCFYKKPDATSLLLKYIDKIDIFEASAAGKFDMVAYLVYTNPDLIHQYNTEGFTPLALACYFGQYEVARYLAFKGADVNQSLNDGSGIRPIHLAVAANHIDIVRMLIEHDVQINVQHNTGITPLHYAAKHGDPDMLIELLENGGDLTLAMQDGSLPADLAREKGYEEIATILS